MKTGPSMLMQGVKRLTPQNCFAELRTHLTRATVTFDYAFRDYTEAELQKREEEITRIDKEEPFQMLIYDESEPAEEGRAAQEMLLHEYAATFCRDGERWIQNDEILEKQQKQALEAMEDWLIMRRAAREESHILVLNKVGIERDEKKKRENVAKHVGLAMPKEFN